MSSDIQPPPSVENGPGPSKKSLKRQRYKQNKRNAKRFSDKENQPPAVDLKSILRTKMKGFRSQRTGGREIQARQVSKAVQSGDLTLSGLMARLGLTDPIAQKRAMETIQSSGITDMRGLIQTIQTLVKIP